MREKDDLYKRISKIQEFDQKIEDIKDLLDLAEEEKDIEIFGVVESELNVLELDSQNLQLDILMSGEADDSDCFIEIHAGAGGLDAQDWAKMLERMYLRWIDLHGYTADCIECSYGEEVGIKSVIYHVKGKKVYGWIKKESGIHRLVRISPFDSSSRRHTSFASIAVYPVVDKNINIKLVDKDIRIDTYRASGAGGQHINKTDSAVRLTHKPTGIVVQCQNNRSQHRNKAKAIDILKSRIYEQELKKREAESLLNYESKTDIGWGHQIRSYVLHPYQIVKDLRTNIERVDVQNVLDGDLDDFLKGSLLLVK